ncbi:MAG: DUF2752 domain-containing protein [Clostridiales bacterium]|nr:DUF2752 domain-containing protein [Clostridiales bacterium]
MKSRINKNALAKAAYIAIPIIAILCVILLKDVIIIVANNFPKCRFHKLTGGLCPGCGNTRSVIALLNFNIIKSLKYNITPILLGTIILILYIELGTYLFGRHRAILPRSNLMLALIIVLMLLYYVVRNFVPYISP